MFTATLPERPTIDQVRSHMLGAGEYLHGLRAKAPHERGEGYDSDVRSATEFINHYDTVLTALVAGSQSGPEVAVDDMSNPGNRSLGALVVNSEAYENRGNLAASFQEIKLDGALLGRDGHALRTTIDTDDDLTGGAGGMLPQGQPIAPVPRQARLFIRDLLAVQGTSLNSIPYVREYTPVTTETGASSVSEAIAKPEVEMLWESDDAPVRKVAGWVPVTTEILEDATTLQGYINTRLAYMVALREEQQLLTGAGTGPDLKGIMTYTTQTQAAGADDPATLGAAIGKVEAVDGDADGIIMHPTDYWTMLVTRYANQLDGGFSTGAPGAVPFQSVWGLPVLRSRVAVAQGSAIVGAFALGATLFDRKQTSIRIGNQHSDFFTTNKVAILAEERIALAVHRPDFFVDVTL